MTFSYAGAGRALSGKHSDISAVPTSVRAVAPKTQQLMLIGIREQTITTTTKNPWLEHAYDPLELLIADAADVHPETLRGYAHELATMLTGKQRPRARRAKR